MRPVTVSGIFQAPLEANIVAVDPKPHGKSKEHAIASISINEHGWGLCKYELHALNDFSPTVVTVPEPLLEVQIRTSGACGYSSPSLPVNRSKGTSAPTVPNEAQLPEPQKKLAEKDILQLLLTKVQQEKLALQGPSEPAGTPRNLRIQELKVKEDLLKGKLVQ